MKTKIWLASWLAIVITALCIAGYNVYDIDPYFHYHKPLADKYFYSIDNQRSQNDGISKHFDYDAIITGTSMTENFRTSELDHMWECHSIKVPFSGGSYKEINDNLTVALSSNPNLKLVIRGLDMGKFTDAYNNMRFDLGEYPDYLYNTNPLDDVNYLLNRDIVFNRVYPMIKKAKEESGSNGLTSFDNYSRWQEHRSFGVNSVFSDQLSNTNTNLEEICHSTLTDDERATIEKNITLNVTDIADQYPHVDFYYFYPPYSIASWEKMKRDGKIYKQLEAEAYVTELILSHPNIHLFSFNNNTELTTDLNNYRDANHYASWINTLILKWMHDGQYQLTQDNYKEYLQKEYDFYTNYDYSNIKNQVDYEADYYAAALLNKELTGTEPLNLLNDYKDIVTNNANIITNPDTNNVYLDCHGALARNPEDDMSDYIRDTEYIGAKFTIDLGDGYEGYNYLCFNGQKITDDGEPLIYIYDENGIDVLKFEIPSSDLDNEIHQYALDLSTLRGTYTIVLNGGAIDNTQSYNSCFQYSNLFMY